jgi:hypothetical protein
MGQCCTATKRDGTPCQAWAVRGTDPPLCAAHGGGSAPVGAPVGNQNAVTHGFYIAPTAQTLATIESVIDDLATKQLKLSHYIDTHLDLDIEQMVMLMALHGQNASRLGRLLRDKRALTGESSDGIAGAIAQALDELSTEIGVKL